MEMMGKRWMARSGMVIAIAVMAAGCGSRQRDATDAAISAAQGAVDSVKTEAEKYVPEQVDAAEKSLQSAREALAKNDYQSALAKAQDAANQAKEMAKAAVGKKEEWEQAWKELNESLPKAMDQVNARIYAYSHGARMPEGMDQDVLEEAKAEYARMKQGWEDAKSAAASGKLGEAIEKGTGVKELLEKLREMVGIHVKTENGN
jgi:uncharacterized phage infection (PIP) family protein YhgE